MEKTNEIRNSIRVLKRELQDIIYKRSRCDKFQDDLLKQKQKNLENKIAEKEKLLAVLTQEPGPLIA